MRKILFNNKGEAAFYVTGAGVIFNELNNAVGIVHREQGLALENQLEPVTGEAGEVVAWFDDAFLWNTQGELLAFVKGANAHDGFELPQTKKLTFKLEPKTSAFKPLLARVKPPERQWPWASSQLTFVVGEHYA